MSKLNPQYCEYKTSEMKLKTIFLLLIITGQFGYSQSWNPFVKGQNSYFKQQFDNSFKVENFLLDSSLFQNNSEIYYFNSKSTLKNECSKNIKKELSYFEWLKNPHKIESLTRNGDSLLYFNDFSSEIDTFLFKPYSNLNESWTTNGITIRCSKLGDTLVFGDKDSIKTFVCKGNNFDNVEFILSKIHGFIKFLPFSEFLNHSSFSGFPPYFELIGYKINDVSKGYRQPKFSDYFHLSNGDMLYWRDYSNPDDIIYPSLTHYHVDSITSVFISEDSVCYNYKRIDYSESGIISHIGDYNSFHLRKDEGIIVSNNTSWYGVIDDRYQPSEIFFIESLYIDVDNEDTVTTIQYLLPGVFIDTSDCQVGMAADYDLTVRFSTREGKTFQGTYSWGESSTTLIGSIIDGTENGTINIPIGINNAKVEEYKVYPNPFNNYISIGSQNNMINQIEIFDAMGNSIIRMKNYKDRLYLGGLKSGIYVLKITDLNNNIRHTKIIKQ